MKSTLEILTSARDLLADQSRWCKHAAALLADGSVAPGDRDQEGYALHPDAVAWCVVGACQVAAEDASLRFDDDRLKPLRRTIGGDQAIGPWNDMPSRTHAEVLAAFDRAIAAASEHEGVEPLPSVEVPVVA